MYENSYQEYKDAIDLFENECDCKIIKVTNNMSYKKCFKVFKDILNKHNLNMDDEALLTVLQMSDKDMDQKFSMAEFIHLYKNIMLVISNKDQ